MGADDYNLYAINITDSILSWKYKTGGLIHCRPTVSEDGSTVYAGSTLGQTGEPTSDHNLYAMNTADGSLRYSHRLRPLVALTNIF